MQRALYMDIPRYHTNPSCPRDIATGEPEFVTGPKFVMRPNLVFTRPTNQKCRYRKLRTPHLHIQSSAGGTTANQVDDAQCSKSESVFTEDQSL
jgi:hypothetical protein